MRGGDKNKRHNRESKKFLLKSSRFRFYDNIFYQKGSDTSVENGRCNMKTPGINKYDFWGYSLIARFARRAHTVPIPNEYQILLLGIL
jgi:hypothetical protein